MMKAILFTIFSCALFSGWAQYAPPAGQAGTTAIHKDSNVFVNWGHEVISFQRGPEDIATANSPLVTFGDSTEALGYPEGNSADVVSLGDGGAITIALAYPIKNDLGPDFAIFENSFQDDFLELAFVAVSTDGQTFVRFPAISLTDTIQQVGTFGSVQATNIHNLAGKYRQAYGTPFDLTDLIDSSGVNLDSINFIRITDVIGTVNSQYASRDANGQMINDPYPTPFGSGGFDLDGIGVIHENNIYASLTPQTVNFQVYPNPVQTNFTLSGIEGNFKLKIYNMSGQCVLEAENTPYIDVSLLKNGFYIVSITTIKSTLNKNIIIKH